MARELCIFMKEVGWNPDRTVMMKIVYNGTRMSEGVLLYNCLVHKDYMGVPKGQQSHFQKRKVVLSKVDPEEIIK